MRAAHRVELELRTGTQTVKAAVRGSLTGRVLLVAQRHPEVLDVWLDCDTDLPQSEVTFLLTDTGAEVPREATHVGSCVAPDGYHIRHVWRI